MILWGSSPFIGTGRDMSEKSGKIPLREWQEVLEKYNFKCAYCGKKAYLTVDHVIPRARGGRTVKENVVPACTDCNTKKANHWYITGGVYEN